MLGIGVALLHYALAVAVFLIMASYAGDIDGLNPPLTGIKEKLLVAAFYALLFPFGYLPLGVLFNSALLGVGLYLLLDWRAKKRLKNGS